MAAKARIAVRFASEPGPRYHCREGTARRENGHASLKYNEIS